MCRFLVAYNVRSFLLVKHNMCGTSLTNGADFVTCKSSTLKFTVFDQFSITGCGRKRHNIPLGAYQLDLHFIFYWHRIWDITFIGWTRRRCTKRERLWSKFSKDWSIANIWDRGNQEMMNGRGLILAQSFLSRRSIFRITSLIERTLIGCWGGRFRPAWVDGWTPWTSWYSYISVLLDVVFWTAGNLDEITGVVDNGRFGSWISDFLEKCFFLKHSPRKVTTSYLCSLQFH